MNYSNLAFGLADVGAMFRALLLWKSVTMTNEK